MAYYFFRTVKVEGRQRLRPLTGQTDESGNPINPDYDVQSDSAIRSSYPTGTVFGSTELQLRTASQPPFHAAGCIHPLGIPEKDYVYKHHKPSKEMEAAWENYQDTARQTNS